MKEIKFKAWERNLKEIIPVDDIDFKNRIINTKHTRKTFDEIVLLQYIGLKDSEGNELYEYDVIEDNIDGFLWVIVYNDGEFLAYGGGYDLYESLDDLIPERYCTRIGCVFKNKEWMDKLMQEEEE